MTAAAQATRLLLVCTAAGLGGFLFGFDSIVISGAIPLIKTQFALNASAEGLFVAASPLGCMISAPIAGVLADRYGRRFNFLMVGLLTIVATMLTVIAHDVPTLVISRFVSGLGVGVASMVCSLYISEIAPANRRGLYVSFYQFAITIGIVASLVSNYAILAAGTVRWITALFGGDIWRAMVAVQIVPSLIFLFLCLVIPESPRWLFGRGREGAAREVLARLMPREEVDSTMAAMAVDQRAEAREGGGYSKLFSRAQRRPLEIALAVALFSELSGISVVFYYGPSILESSGLALGSAVGGFAIIGVVNMVATVIALWLIDRLGRRPLLLWGTIGAVACLVTTGLLLAAGSKAHGLLVLAICGYVACFAFSLGPVKFVVAAEVFSNEMRARAMALFIFICFAAGSIINFLFPILREAFGAEANFFLFAALLAPQVFYVLFRLPETSRRSLEDIQTMWRAPAAGALR